MIKILFQGDSITDGNRYKDPEKRWDLNHQIGHSYVYPIVATLGRRFPGKYHFVNRGVSGDCIDRIAARWQRDVLDENPDLLSILIGINGNGNIGGFFPEGVDVHLEHFNATYRRILDLAKKNNPNIKLVIIEPFVLPVGKYKAVYDDFMKVFRCKQAIVEQIAKDYGAVFIPLQERLETLVKESSKSLSLNGCEIDPNAYWLWDGIHPTEAFHGYISELWLDATKDLLG